MAEIYAPDIEDARDLKNVDGFIFTFVGEWGRLDLSYAEYLKHKKLRECINDTNRYRLALGRTVFSYSFNFLKNNSDVTSNLKLLEKESKLNPLRFFAPSGRESLDFLNNSTDGIVILTACNRFGKTQNGIIKMLINTLPCDPTWEIFSKYGVKHVPYIGARVGGISSYELSSHEATLLPMLLNWSPTDQLGKYAKSYKGKGAKRVSLRADPYLRYTCGTEFRFLACSQGQGPYESDVREFWLWDEQGEEAKFDGADERTRSTPTGGRHYMPMTPHKVDGRPDTGGGSWISKLWNAKEAKGRSIAKYKGSVWDVPDWIYPEASKVIAYNKWVVEPARDQNDKVMREGLSRFFGDWHESSGLVIDEWDKKRHVIEPFDIPENWSRYRAVDHGSSSHPTACLWAAVSPAGDIFFYKEYLKIGNVISKSCRDIIELSGNSISKIGRYEDPRSGLVINKFEEIETGTKFQYTIFDGRAYSQTDSGNTGLRLSDLYAISGIRMKKGAGQRSEIYVPILKEWFAIDNEKKHFSTGEYGAPRVYVFSSCRNFISQIRGWVWEERKSRSATNALSPRKKDDDLMDCMKILIQANPRFRGNVTLNDSKYYKFLKDWENEDTIITDKPIDRISNY